MSAPMSDDELVALAQHRFDQADRPGATHGDCQQLRDIFPAVLARLREKVEIARDFAALDRMPVDGPRGWEKQADIADGPSDADQLQLSLLHL